MKLSFRFSRTRLYQTIAAALVMGAAVPVQAIDGVPPYPAVVPLNSLNATTTGFRVDGKAYQYSGTSVGTIGDFNGDGIDDIAIGAPQDTFDIAGRVYVVFGRNYAQTMPFPSSFDVSNLLTLTTTSSNEDIGVSVSPAGDINGDSIPDLVIGNAQNHAYVVFGSINWQAGTTFDMSNMSVTQGFRIDGPSNSYLGISVSAAGDFNGDGIDDLMIGTYYQDQSSGSAYVIFGHQTNSPPTNQPFPAVIDVSTTQLDGQSTAKSQMGGGYVNGFRVDGAAVGDDFGARLGRASKFNNDAYDDLIIGAYRNTWNGTESGAAYVILGRPLPIPNGVLTMNNINVPGVLTLTGATAGDTAGLNVAGGGDLNGDGRDDVAVSSSTNTYVVYGRSNLTNTQSITVNLSNIGTSSLPGFRLNGRSNSLSFLPDANNDGRDDLLIGRRDESPQGKIQAGNSYVLFGRPTSPVPNILSLLDSLKGLRGYRLEGTSAGDVSGFAVAAAGDINKDGVQDLIIGARQANPNGITRAGSSYVVFGNNDRIFGSGLEANE